jgi:hypothetical protein
MVKLAFKTNMCSPSFPTCSFTLKPFFHLPCLLQNNLFMLWEHINVEFKSVAKINKSTNQKLKNWNKEMKGERYTKTFQILQHLQDNNYHTSNNARQHTKLCKNQELHKWKKNLWSKKVRKYIINFVDSQNWEELDKLWNITCRKNL